MSADPGYRVDPDLKIAFDYLGTIEEGDRVEITSDRKVQRVSSIGSATELGTVLTIRAALTECVVACEGQFNRQDRVAGETVVPGKFVYGPSNKVYQYTQAAPASFVGSTTGPKTVTVDTDDTIKVTLENGDAQTVVITAGTNLTFAAIAAELNASLVGITAFVDASGHIGLRADSIGKAITVGAVTHDAYTLLGWTAATYAPTNASHDPSTVKGLILVGGDADETVEVIEY